MRKILSAALFFCLSLPAFAQVFPPGPYGSSGGSSSGGGGGGTTGTVNAAPQNEVPFYSVVGSSNVLSGTSTFFLYSSSAVYSGSTGLFVTVSGQPSFTLNSTGGNASFIEFRGGGHDTWDFGKELIGSDVGLEWYDVTSGTNIDEMKLNSAGDLTLSGKISASSTTINGVAYTWPGAQGGSSTLLQNNGSGALTWATISTSSTSPAGLDTQIQLNSNANFGASSKFTFNTTNSVFNINDGSGTSIATTLASGNSDMTLTSSNGSTNITMQGGNNSLQYTALGATTNHWYYGLDGGSLTGHVNDFFIDKTGLVNVIDISQLSKGVGIWATPTTDIIELGIATQLDTTLTVTGNSALGTTLGTGTQMYRCSGGTDAGWLLYGNTGAAQTLCTGGGGSLVATGVFLP